MALRSFTNEMNLSPVIVTTFNPRNPDIEPMILRQWNIIQYSTDCAENFPQTPIIGYRRTNKEPERSDLPSVKDWGSELTAP
jgi:hypothetical protein